MVISKTAICPTCGSKIFIRVEKGDYLSQYPIRINCGKCKTLIKGLYAENFGIYLSNADYYDTVVNENNEIDAEYLAEISGELPCYKVKKYNRKFDDDFSPFLRVSDKMYDGLFEQYLERLKSFSPNYKKWDTKVGTYFQLFQDKSYDYLK